MDFAVSAARWALSKALAPATAGVLKAWAASKNLGGETDALLAQLLYVQAMLHQTDGREIDNPYLNELLVMLRLLAYDADDVLDELDYFRIQDELDGTFHAADTHAGNCVQGLLHHAYHTAKAVVAQLKPSSSSRARTYGEREDQANSSHASPTNQDAKNTSATLMQKLAFITRNSTKSVGNEPQVQTVQTPKLKFDRVTVSLKMADIVQQLKPICLMVSDILNKELQGSKDIAATTIERPITSEDILEPKLFGREVEKQMVVDSITHGEYSTNDLTVIPIVGPGGIGKTTFAQHVYNEVKSHFQVTVWICVSLNFNANRLVQEASQKMPVIKDETKFGSDKELIEQRIKGKRFLLVLDDMWGCDEYEWEKLVLPFRQGGKGSILLVTTRMLDVANFVKTNGSLILLDRLGGTEFREFFNSCISGKNESWSDHPELLETGEQIVAKLKGSPLAAKTVGRLLRKQFTLEHWRRVLKHKEWEQQKSDKDIMPALKVSYDHLPLNLKQCFSYCSLFPEDHEFDVKDLIHFWIGLGVLSPGDQSMRMEDVGYSYINSLVNYGFLKKNEKENGQDYFVIHDLLHDLAVKVSQQDCLRIKVSELGYAHIPPSVRHLSIVVDNGDIEDTVTYKHVQQDLSLLKEKLQVQNLRTLMLFGCFDSFSKAMGTLLQTARSLRTIFLSDGSYLVEHLLSEFSNLVHLRYLRMGQCSLEISLPRTISRLYHLKILDTKGCWRCSIPSRGLSNLINMQHLVAPDNTQHMDIFNVGKMKVLRELRNFKVKKEAEGFELKELGMLLELEMLGLYNLEAVKSRGEASELKLSQKHHLKELVLDWTADRADKDTMQEDTVLESLRPNESLQKLCIKGHGGATCPSWLGVNIIVKTLEFLELNDVHWTSFPPIGEVWLVDELGAECRSHMLGEGFANLKWLELVRIPKLRKWVGSPSQLFSHLKGVTIKDCPELAEVPFSHPAWFPKLEDVEITDCPKLESLPCIPWSRATRSATIQHAGSEIEQLSFREYSRSRFILDITGKHSLDSSFWRVLNSDNLSNIGYLAVWRCPPLPLAVLGNLSTLNALDVVDSGDAFCLTEVRGQCPVKLIKIVECVATGEQLTRVLSYFPKLEHFTVQKCENITGFAVLGQQIGVVDQKRGNEEIAAAASEGLLFLPLELKSLHIGDFPNFVLFSKEQTGDGGGLQCMSFLQTLRINGCPKLLNSYSSSSSSSSHFPFPDSLDCLSIEGTFGAETLLPLSNLTSLTSLDISGCGDLRGDALWSLLAEGCLTRLTISETPNFLAVSEPSLPSLPHKLQTFEAEGIAKVLTVPICTLLSSSLTYLSFLGDKDVERFTKEQEEALQQLTSLDEIRFQNCDKLQGLPPCLYKIPNLKRLLIYQCVAIRSVPKVGLPSTLQELNIYGCPAIQSLPKDRLPSSLQKLEITSCPAIKSIPKVDDLPSSLRELDVQNSESKELRRQCRKLVGTIPIVRA